MKLKPTLLFGVISILLCGCRKVEKQEAVNEINIGVLGVKLLGENDT